MTKYGIYTLEGYGETKPTHAIGVVIPPENTDREKVVSAWAYALRHSAKGLDLPDYEAAFKLLRERHPSWHVYSGTVGNIRITARFLDKADNDVAEGK